VVAAAPDDAIVLRPPAPPSGVADVAAAVRDALRFPLEGEPLEALARRGARATIVVEPAALPIPTVPADPRQLAISAVADELERLGIPTGYQTILVAGGLARRTSQRELGTLVTPELARRFHGRVVVHDVEDPELVELPDSAQPPFRVNAALVDTDLVVVVTAAETVLNGGPAALLAAADAGPQRAAAADSLLETRASDGWRLALALERALARRVPTIGASLVLNHPHVTGALRGYPYDPDAVGRIVRSPLRHVFSALPGPPLALNPLGAASCHCRKFHGRALPVSSGRLSSSTRGAPPVLRSRASVSLTSKASGKPPTPIACQLRSRCCAASERAHSANPSSIRPAATNQNAV